MPEFDLRLQRVRDWDGERHVTRYRASVYLSDGTNHHSQMPTPQGALRGLADYWERIVAEAGTSAGEHLDPKISKSS